MTLLVLGESCDVYFYEALAVLGIDDHTSRDNARRAYLRLLKQHKPEQDPEGFKRVREAYDLVRDILPEVEIPRYDPEEQADPQAHADEPPHSEPVRGTDFSTDDLDPPVSSHRGPPPSSAPSRREVNDLLEREPEASARAGLSTELSPPPSDPPPPLSGEQTAEVPPPESIPDWSTLYRRAEEAEAASDWPLVFAALELAAKHVDAPEPPIAATLRMLLRCIHDEEEYGHDRLFGALAHWIDTTGLEARALRGERVLLWTVVRELRDVAGKLPRPITRGIVDATLKGSIERAHPVFARHAEKFPDETSAAAVLLVERAPYLGRTFGPMLRIAAPEPVFIPPAPPAPPEPTNESFDGWRFVLPVIAAFLLLMRLFLKSEPSAPYTPLDPNKYKFVAPPTLPSLDFHLYQAPEHSALMWARILKQDPLNIAEPALRVATVDLGLKIEMGDCIRARESFDKYVLLLDGSGAKPEDHRRSYTEKLAEYLQQWCPRATDAGTDANTDANVTDAKTDARGAPH